MVVEASVVVVVVGLVEIEEAEGMWYLVVIRVCVREVSEEGRAVSEI